MSSSATRTAFWLLLSCFLRLPSQYALALNPELDVSQYAHKVWRIREGFTTGQIASLAQTPDGYLWLGTEFGLVRFDGVRTSAWQPPAGFSMPDNRIASLLATQDGTLWVGTIRGLVSLRGRRLIADPQFEGAYVTSLLKDRGGTVWVGAGPSPSYRDGSLCAIRSDQTECYGKDGRSPAFVAALLEDRRGYLWVATANGVWRWKPDPPKLYSLPAPPALQVLGETATGAIIVLSENTVQQIIDGAVKELQLPQLPRTFQPTVILCDHDGALWIGSREGLLHVHNGRTDWFARADGLSGDNVTHLFEDREGNIWIATSDGLDRFNVLAATTYSAPQGVIGVAEAVIADNDGSLWLRTTEGLYRWHEGRIAVYRSEHQRSSRLEPAAEPVLDQLSVAGLPKGAGGSLYRDRHGRLWIGTLSELGYLEHNRFIPLLGVPRGYIDSFAEDNEGSLWIAHRDAGLLRLSADLKIQQQFPWKTFGASGVAARLAADPVHGGLWLGSASGGIAYFSNGRVRASYAVREGLGKGSVNHLRVAADGTLWVATERGLSRLKAGRITTFDTKSGLPCDAIDWSIDDGKGSVWLYTRCGLVRLASSDLESWAAAAQEGKASNEKLRMTSLGSDDGVPSFDSIPTSTPHLAATPNGKLWLVTRDGVAVVDPTHLAFNKLPPAVHVEQVIADRKAYDATGRLELPPLARDLEIDYTALSYVAPEKVLFRYKLDGHDRDWQNVGTRRQAFYSNLAPGRYRFRVIACNNSGVWNEQGDALDFSVAPAYWQTIWFRTLCGLVFLGLLWILNQLRVRQVARQFELNLEAQVAERTRIARDLHDTLLQSFHGLLLQFQTAYKLLPARPAEAKQNLGNAIDSAFQAITEGRDAVQGLRASTVGGNDLAAAIKTLGEGLASQGTEQSSVLLRVDVGGTPQSLRPLVRDEIYRIAGEALRNAFRHAGATRIEVDLCYDERQLRLRLRDDGKGIDPQFLREGGQGRNYGIRGMRERAKLIGGSLAVWTAPDSGAEVELSIPASRAYAAPRAAQRGWWVRKLFGARTPIDS